MPETTIFFGKHGQLSHISLELTFDLQTSEGQGLKKMQLCTMCAELLQFSRAYNWVIMYAKV